MILLATQAIPQMEAHAHPNLGRLVTPREWSRCRDHDGLSWAADNDCFQGLDAPAWLAMLDGIACERDRGRLLFATVPDAVGDAAATAAAFDRWAPELERRGLPVGLVAQDGILAPELAGWLDRAWPRLAAVFLGGSDVFKKGPEGAAIAHETRARGLWLHMGRVNSYERQRYAAAIGCQSFDGTGWVTFRTANLDRGIIAGAAPPQMRLAVDPHETPNERTPA